MPAGLECLKRFIEIEGAGTCVIPLKDTEINTEFLTPRLF